MCVTQGSKSWSGYDFFFGATKNHDQVKIFVILLGDYLAIDQIRVELMVFQVNYVLLLGCIWVL